jgi:hypothetical protein
LAHANPQANKLGIRNPKAASGIAMRASREDRLHRGQNLRVFTLREINELTNEVLVPSPFLRRAPQKKYRLFRM